MKKCIALIICLIFAGTVSAWEIGPEVFYDKYEEFVGGKTFMKETGTFYGIVLTSYSPGNYISGFEGELAFGKLDYDGQLQDGTPYKMSDIKDLLADVRFLGGDKLYMGVGYRYLRDDSTSDPVGYLRHSNYLYLPLGLKLSTDTKKGWSLGGTAEFDLLMLGLQVSDLSNVGGPSVTNLQRFASGYGVRAAVSIKNKGDKTDFRIEPFARYWHIGKSDIDFETGWYEPENKTIQYGVQLIWMF